MSKLASRRGDQAKADQCLENARKFAGDNLELRSALASALNRAKHFKPALKEAEYILKLDPTYFEAYPLKWQAKLNLENGSEKARAEVAEEIQALESEHAQYLDVLVAVHRGYTILDDEEGKERAKKAITALAPKFFEPRYGTMTMTMDGKSIRIPGEIMRRYTEANKLKDMKERLEVYRQLEKEIEDADVKHYFLLPAMFRSFIELKDLEGAEQTFETMKKVMTDQQRLAQFQVGLADAYVKQKVKLDAAQELVQDAIGELRQTLKQRESSGNQPSARSPRMALAYALYVQAQLLMQTGSSEQVTETLSESLKLEEQEGSTLDLGLIYSKAGKHDEAVELLAKAYGFAGKRKDEAKAALEQIYGEREKTKPLADLLAGAVESRKKQREEMVASMMALAGAARPKANSPEPAPDFELAMLNGKKLRLSDFRGKVVLLNFWATW
jgi:tetratricopeptide (TPR) repeat protein